MKLKEKDWKEELMKKKKKMIKSFQPLQKNIMLN